MTPQSLTVSGRTIAHYEILEKLGEGGMGVVYKARDTRLDRLVAIKFLSPHLANSPRAHERLLREAHIISTLNHPHIAVIHGIEEWEGETFLVFEHLPGGNLQTRPPHTLAQALQYALQLADALGAAHRHGVVHRDVKPANVLFGEDEALKLADFGLARQSVDDVRLTCAGAALGTPAYMAPELFQGADPDERSDVYSLGIVIHELIAGKLPEAGHALAVPLPLRTVLERALDGDPTRRYPGASEMAADLRTAIAQLDSVTNAATVSFDLPRKKRAFGALLLAVALAAVLVNHSPVTRRSAALPGQLVVLPFTTSDSGRSWQIFCDGLTEILPGELARLESEGSIRVVPAGAVRRQSVASLSDARRMLGARFAVTGNVAPEPGGIRLTLNVVDVRTARPLGMETASFAPEEFSHLQGWAVAGVSHILQIANPVPDQTALDAGRSHQPGAYESYLRGRGYLAHYDVPEDLSNAVAAFHQALQRDPGYALAHAAMAEALWRTWKNSKDPQWLEQASASAQRARQLNDRLAPVHISLGRIENSRGRHQEALRAFRRALELEPLNPDAHAGLAGTWQSMGNLAEAEAAFRKVIELRPGEWPGYNDLAVFYSEQHRFAEAERVFQQMIGLEPENVIAFQNLGGLYLMMGRYGEAGVALERALALKPTAVAYANLGTAYYFEGRFAAAAAAANKAIEQRPADFRLWGNLAEASWWAPGQRERARQAWHSAANLAKQQLAINPADAQVRSSLAVFEAHLGDRAAALAEIARARHSLANNARVLWKAARVYELCGRRSEALAALNAALQTGESPENTRREPDFAAMRHDPVCAQVLPKEVCYGPDQGKSSTSTRTPEDRTRSQTR